MRTGLSRSLISFRYRFREEEEDYRDRQWDEKKERPANGAEKLTYKETE